ncbi:MAG TPA: hypothetical protein VMZ33_03945 [Candidatus Limnocylindrales bacterium]|nr:hypothetical protein [Candidatus Limnocylindrales bacterium]
MIVVVGRPRLDDAGAPAGLATLVCLAARGHGGGAELVGRVSDNPAGDQAIVELGRAGVGHAAVLRDPTGASGQIEAADVELALRYITECNVLVVAEPLADDALRAVIDGAAYHRAALVVITPSDAVTLSTQSLPPEATVLQAPDEGEGPFAQVVGRYAARLDAGDQPADAWRAAMESSGWEQAGQA